MALVIVGFPVLSVGDPIMGFTEDQLRECEANAQRFDQARVCIPVLAWHDGLNEFSPIHNGPQRIGMITGLVYDPGRQWLLAGLMVTRKAAALALMAEPMKWGLSPEVYICKPGGSDIRVDGVQVPGLRVQGLMMTGLAVTTSPKFPLPFELQRVGSARRSHHDDD